MDEEVIFFLLFVVNYESEKGARAPFISSELEVFKVESCCEKFPILI
jgi:hypothetical protein